MRGSRETTPRAHAERQRRVRGLRRKEWRIGGPASIPAPPRRRRVHKGEPRGSGRIPTVIHRVTVRTPAMKVVVLQCLCGRLATSRAPRRQRPCRRASLVLSPVSSRKINRVGSSAGWRSAQAARAVLTAGRRCSSAWPVFFCTSAPAADRTPTACQGARPAGLSGRLAGAGRPGPKRMFH